MNREERAKQFAPFDALKGLQEALRAKEEKYECILKREPPVEEQDEMNKIISEMTKGQMIKATYYLAGKYLEIKGIVTQIDKVFKYIKVNETEIRFEDILKLQIERVE